MSSRSFRRPRPQRHGVDLDRPGVGLDEGQDLGPDVEVAQDQRVRLRRGEVPEAPVDQPVQGAVEVWRARREAAQALDQQEAGEDERPDDREQPAARQRAVAQQQRALGARRRSAGSGRDRAQARDRDRADRTGSASKGSMRRSRDDLLDLQRVKPRRDLRAADDRAPPAPRRAAPAAAWSANSSHVTGVVFAVIEQEAHGLVGSVEPPARRVRPIPPP